MAIIGLKLDAVRWYESKYDPDRGSENASQFQIGSLDSRIFGRLRDQATRFVVDPNAAEEEVETAIQASEVNFQTVQYGLKGWKNVTDEAGNDIPFKMVKRRHGGQSYDVLDDGTLKLIPAAIIEELAHEISKRNDLSEKKAKNSDTP